MSCRVWTIATPCWPVFQLPHWHRSSEFCTQRHAPLWISSLVTVWLQLFESCTGCQSLRGSSTSCACRFTSRFWDTRRNISQTFWHRLPIFQVDLHCVLIVWQPRRAADTLTNWRQSFFCCCTASVEHATDGAERKKNWNCCDRWTCFVVIWKHFVSFCLRALRYRLTLWCALGHLVGAQYLRGLSYS